MDRLFVDTSAWFAYVNRKDPDHDAVRRALNSFQGRLTTTNFILDETISLCRYRLGHPAAKALGSALLDSQTVDLVRTTPEDEHGAWMLFCQRPDQRYSFTDCTSFVVMRRLQIPLALALDEDFRAEGFVVVP